MARSPTAGPNEVQSAIFGAPALFSFQRFVTSVDNWAGRATFPLTTVEKWLMYSALFCWR
jgi:hypothetical protein